MSTSGWRCAWLEKSQFSLYGRITLANGVDGRGDTWIRKTSGREGAAEKLDRPWTMNQGRVQIIAANTYGDATERNN